jgi:hypothetical protein
MVSLCADEGVKTMAYDSLNRMTSVSGPGVSETFAYRGDKWHRAGATSSGVST